MITPMRIGKWRGLSIGFRVTPTLRGWRVEEQEKAARVNEKSQVSVKPSEEHDSRRKESWSDKD